MTRAHCNRYIKLIPCARCTLTISSLVHDNTINDYVETFRPSQVSVHKVALHAVCKDLEAFATFHLGGAKSPSSLQSILQRCMRLDDCISREDIGGVGEEPHILRMGLLDVHGHKACNCGRSDTIAVKDIDHVVHTARKWGSCVAPHVQNQRHSWGHLLHDILQERYGFSFEINQLCLDCGLVQNCCWLWKKDQTIVSQKASK